MKRSAIVLFSLVGISCALVQADDKAPGDPASAMAQMQQKLLQQFDTNKDGMLSDQEKMIAQEMMRRQGMNLGVAPGGFPGADQFGKQFDRDGDGKLSPQEMAVAQAAFNRMRNNGPPRTGFIPGGNAGGFAPPPVIPTKPAGDNKKSKVNPLVKRFDKDGDGKLNDKEKADAQAELKKGKSKDAKGAKDKDDDAKPAKKPDGK